MTIVFFYSSNRLILIDPHWRRVEKVRLEIMGLVLPSSYFREYRSQDLLSEEEPSDADGTARQAAPEHLAPGVIQQVDSVENTQRVPNTEPLLIK